jgi:HlyD family secretion protein
MSRMYVLVFVDESDIGNIRHGQPVQVTVDAFPDEKFEGEVVRVATKGKSNSNVVTFEVKVEVTGANKFQMKPGMTANVEIVVVDKKDVIRVPVKAVHQNSKQCFVMMATDKTEAVKREITMGETDGDWIEILSGLKDGDKVQVTKQKQSTWRRNTEEDRPMPPGGGMSPGMMNGGGGPPR